MVDRPFFLEKKSDLGEAIARRFFLKTPEKAYIYRDFSYKR
jgi:hypothetical protein